MSSRCLQSLGLVIFLSINLTATMGCASLFEPTFVKENRRKGAEFLQAHPSADGNTPFGSRNVHYVHTGASGKPKVIFVHGSPGDWVAWIHQLQDSSLASRAQLIAGDRLGYGGSDPGHTERSLDQQAQAMMTLLDTDDPQQPAILVGHSYGGPVVARMAMTGDPRIRGVVMLAGSVDPELEPRHWYQIPADWAIFRWMIPDSLVVCNQEILALRDELVRVMPLWDQITARFTVIQGAKDELVAPGNADFVAKKLLKLNPEIIRVEDLNHFIPWGRPDLVHDAIERQLDLLAKFNP